MKVCFDTFGCRLNRAEALDQEAEYVADGWTVTEKHSEADLIIVRCCSVTRHAQRDCEKLIEHLKRKYPNVKLKIEGCTKERSTVALPAAFSPRSATEAVPTRTARAYLKVQDGCNGQCTFCIVPQFRGKSVSIDFDKVLERAKKFIAAGYHEIVVTGCNLSQYLSNGKRIPDLLAALAELDDGCRIRLGSLEPSPVAKEVLRVIAAHKNICRFVHIPIQSGSSGILTMMKRPYDIKALNELILQAKSLVPGIALGCDLMTGFPGESELDFLATKGFFSRNSFSRAHVFPYSERPGTVATTLPMSIPKPVRSSRAKALVRLADEKRCAAAKNMLGRTVEIVVEDEKTCSGWTSEYFWCTIRGGKAPRKSLARAIIHTVQGHQLIGKAI